MRSVKSLVTGSIAVMTLAFLGPAPAVADDGGEAPPVSGSRSLFGLDVLGVRLPLDVPTPDLYPLIDLSVPPAGEPAERGVDGGAVGVYSETTVSDLIELTTGPIGTSLVNSPSNTSTHSSSHRVLSLGFVSGITTETGTGPARYPDPEPNPTSVRTSAMIADVDFSVFLNVKALTASASVHESSPGRFNVRADLDAAEIMIMDRSYDMKDIAPNTTYELPGLGKVVVNEQTITERPGDVYAAQVHALHIKVEVPHDRLPVGTDIYIGTAQAVMYDDGD